MKAKTSYLWEEHFAVELFLIILCLAFWLYRLKGMLFSGITLPIHDAYYWEYPLFSFFAENLMQGQIPLWNPYTHGGEPFYPILVHLKFLDPLAIGSVFFGKFFTHDTAILLSWYRFIQTSVMSLGTWWLLRRFAKHLATRCALVLEVFFSSLFIGGYRQHGIILLGAWVPFVAMLCLHIFKDKNYQIRNFLLLGWLVGMQFQTYYYIGVWLFLLLTVVAVICFYPKDLKAWIQSKERWNILWAFGIIILMALPNLVLFKERTDFVYPARQLENGVSEPQSQPYQYEDGKGDTSTATDYHFIEQTGTFSTPWDFLQTLSPHANRAVSRIEASWGEASEAYLYFGVLVWVLCIVGIFFGEHSLKKVGLVVFFASGLLLLGPPGGLHQLLYYLFPPLRPLRHTASLSLIFEFSVIYFFVLGMNSFLGESQKLWERMCLAKGQWAGNVLGALILSACFITLTKAKYPQSQQLYLCVIGVVTVAFWLTRSRGKNILFWSVLGAQGLAVVFLSQTPRTDLARMIVMGLLPFMIVLWPRNFGLKSFIVGMSILALLGCDLMEHLQSKFILSGFTHPRFLVEDLNATSSNKFPQVRQLYSQGSSQYFQAIRYLELLRHEPVAFSATESGHESKLVDTLKAKRWNSLLAMKTYSNLIHRNQELDLLKNAFRLGLDPIQFGNKAASYRVLTFHSGRLNLEVETPESTWLYWADGFHPGWEAKIDGNTIPIELSKINFKLVSIPPGKHRLSFEFRPQLFNFSLRVFLILLLGIPVLLMLSIAIKLVNFEPIRRLEILEGK